MYPGYPYGSVRSPASGPEPRLGCAVEKHCRPRSELARPAVTVGAVKAGSLPSVKLTSNSQEPAINRSMKEQLSLFRHSLSSPSAFTPEALVNAVRNGRAIEEISVPPICVLDFDGDLTDWLLKSGLTRPHPGWACFHTTMHTFQIDGMECGLIARTIGGPYAVLVAEQLCVSGAQIILGLTSAGRVSPSLPLPSLVVATSAIRDEGTSYHYLPAADVVPLP